MFAARSLLRSSTMRVGRNMMARKISTAAPAPVGPVSLLQAHLQVKISAKPDPS